MFLVRLIWLWHDIANACAVLSAFQAGLDLMTAGAQFFYFLVLFGTNG
jgi:hypothetical protein